MPYAWGKYDEGEFAGLDYIIDSARRWAKPSSMPMMAQSLLANIVNNEGRRCRTPRQNLPFGLPLDLGRNRPVGQCCAVLCRPFAGTTSSLCLRWATHGPPIVRLKTSSVWQALIRVRERLAGIATCGPEWHWRRQHPVACACSSSP